MMNTVISFPIPPYSNVPIQPQNFQPSVFFISNISLGFTTTITTTVNHNYVIGQEIRLLIPNGFGCTALNEQTGFIINIPAPNQLTINLSSIGVSAFTPNSQLKTQPQTIAVGSINTGAINANGLSPTSTIIPGSFINISPQL
jgi:hypothetical protein